MSMRGMHFLSFPDDRAAQGTWRGLSRRALRAVAFSPPVRARLQARYERLLAVARHDEERERLAYEHACEAVRLRTALEHVRDEYGGAAGYLREAGGAVRVLRARLAA